MKTALAAAASALLVFAATAASAQNPDRAAMRQACAADVAKFCPDKTGKERHECMMAHKAEVSDGCKAAVMKAMQGMQGMQGMKPQ